MNKQLYRSTNERMLGGVCGGLAEYSHMDVSMVRLIAVLFAFAGVGVLAYIVAWIIIPEEKQNTQSSELEYTMSVKNSDSDISTTTYNYDSNPQTEVVHGDQRSNLLIGFIMVGIGGYLIARRAFPYIPFSEYFWPVALVIAGVFLLIKRDKR